MSRSGRTLAILWLGLLCLGPQLTPPVQTENQPACNNTYPSNVQCGMSVLKPSNGTSSFFNSSVAIRGEFPWHVAIMQLEQRVPVYSCGGSLVSNRFVITAAHCVVNQINNYPFSKDMLHLQFGYHQLNVTEEGCTQHLGVKSVLVHPEYHSEVKRHDLAILESERPVRFNDRVLPICLDTDNEDQTGGFYRSIGKVPGWGNTGFDNTASTLRMTEVPIVNDTECISSNSISFANTIYPGAFCGGYANGTNVCNGDSGGGLITFRSGRWELQGIVSFTAVLHKDGKDVCDTEKYAGFVKVRFYKHWIRTILESDQELAKNNETERGTSSRTEETFQLPTDCGKRQIKTGLAIVNGVRSYEGQWPWHAAIFSVFGKSLNYLCGGTLVSPIYVLTLASCVTDLDPGSFIVHLGQIQLFQRSIVSRDVEVLDVEKSDDSTLALLKLQVQVQYGDYIQPICLPTTAYVVDSDSTWRRIGTNGTITGYGWTKPNGKISQYLQSTTVPIVDSSRCVQGGVYKKDNAIKMFCAGYGNGTGACKGDEGGGFYELNQHDAWTLTGVIDLHGEGCDTNGYIGLKDLLFYSEWLTDRIVNVQTENTEAGQRMVYFFTSLIALVLVVLTIVTLLLIVYCKRPIVVIPTPN